MATGRGAAAEFADFLMLQTINRFEPLFAHYADSGALHPEELYRAVRVGGGRAGDLHDHRPNGRRNSPDTATSALRESFEPVMAVAARIAERCAGAERDLDSARGQEVRDQRGDRDRSDALHDGRLHPRGARRPAGGGAAAPLSRAAQGRAGRKDPRPRDAAAAGRAGARRVPVAPRQIPFHAGFAYFELDQTSDLWEQLKTSGGLALHVAGEFPGLAMEFWAIRS